MLLLKENDCACTRIEVSHEISFKSICIRDERMGLIKNMRWRQLRLVLNHIVATYLLFHLDSRKFLTFMAYKVRSVISRL